MKKLKLICGFVLYNMVGKRLPVSYSVIKIGQKKFRAFCGRLLLEKCGEHVNIEKNARFSPRVELGDRSGIGLNAFISGKCVIGNDVMMGPNCTIYCRNHNFGDTTTSMGEQGDYEEPVIIEDDVWIGGHVIILPGVHVGAFYCGSRLCCY